MRNQKENQKEQAVEQRENYRYHYVKYSSDGNGLKQDRTFKRMLRDLPDMDVTGIYFDLILEALKPHKEKNPNPDDIVLEFFHEDSTFAEEIAFTIDRNADQVERFLERALHYGILEEKEEDVYIIRFPDGATGSITDSSIRSQKCRENKRLLQSNTEATKCNTETANIKEKEREKIKSEMNIDRHSDINIHKTTFDLNNYIDSAGPAAGAVSAATLAGGEQPGASQLLFSFAEVKEQADRRVKKKLTDAELEAMFKDFVSNDFGRARQYMEKGEERTAALFHAVNSWASQNQRTEDQGAEIELEDLKMLTDGELKKIFPLAYEDGSEGRALIRDFFDYGLFPAKYSDDPVDEDISQKIDGLRNVVCNNVPDMTDIYFDRKSKRNDEQEEVIAREIKAIFPGKTEDDILPEELIPYYIPYKKFTTEQRRILFTFLGIRFPISKGFKVRKDPFKEGDKAEGREL